MGIIIKNKTSWQLYLEVFAAVVNIYLNFTLIPVIGREAAAITTLFSYSVMVIGSYFMVKKVNPISNLNIKMTIFYLFLGMVFAISSLYFVLGRPIIYTLIPVLFMVITYHMFKKTYID